MTPVSTTYPAPRTETAYWITLAPNLLIKLRSKFMVMSGVLNPAAYVKKWGCHIRHPHYPWNA
jgi:hypothetical protein